MPAHLQQVIELGGGNEYREERVISGVRSYNSQERRGEYAVRNMGIRAGDEDE